MKISHIRFGILLGLGVQAPKSMVLVSSRCSRLVSMYSRAQFRPISFSTMSGDQACISTPSRRRRTLKNIAAPSAADRLRHGRTLRMIPW